MITHIGLAMIGEGEVDYNGKRMPAQEALTAVGLEPLDPFARDALTIISSNAYSGALAALAIEELKHILKISKIVFALSIQGLNGNIEPFLSDSNHVRPFPIVNQISADIRDLLADSYLWDQSKTRPLQDPLSYRTAAYTIGVVEKSLLELERLLKIQLNSSDDNPGVVLDVLPPSDNYEEASHYVIKGDVSGAVLPTANFSPLVWVITFEELAIALSHASNASAQRTIKLSDDHFTRLSRFLGTKNTVHAYGAIQKVFISLAAENQELAIHVSIASYAIAGTIEDTATNAPRVMRRVRTMIDNLYYILGIELMHAAQAVNLRLQQNPDLALSSMTEKFRSKYRKVVPFLDKDRVLTPDIEASYQF